MSEVLIIRLGSHYDSQVSWMIWSSVEQEIIASGELNGLVELAQLGERSQGRNVKVLVPGCDVTLRTVTLPGKLNRQLMTALPFMLEDDLTQDVESLFFAYGRKIQKDGAPALEVAIVAHAVMAQWLAWLEEANIQTHVIVPDSLCLPCVDEGISALQLGDQWLIRSDYWEAECIDEIWFEQYMQLKVTQQLVDPTDTSDDTTSPSQLKLVCHSPCDLDNQQVRVVDEERQLPLQLLAANVDSLDFNLRQGAYVKKKQSSQLWKTWRLAASVAVVAILLQLVYRGAMWWQLENQLDEQKTLYVQQYKAAYPGERTRPNLIERQLKKRLRETSGSGASGETFLLMLDKVAPLFVNSEGFAPDIIKFDSKRQELRVNAIADGYQRFEKFKMDVEGLGYQVHQGSLSNNSDNLVTGVITIKGA